MLKFHIIQDYPIASTWIKKKCDSVSRSPQALETMWVKKSINDGKQRKNHEAWVLHESGEENKRCSARKKRKAAGWIKERLWGACVCLTKRCYEKPFSIETRVHAKTDEFAAFLGSSFFKIFIVKKTICSSLSFILILNYS